VLDGEGGRYHEIAFRPAEESVYAMTMEVDLSGETPTGTGTLQSTGLFAPGSRISLESEERRTEQFGEEIAQGFPGVRLTEATFEGLTEIETDVSATFAFEGGDFVRGQGAEVTLPLFAQGGSLQRRYASTSTRELPVSVGVPFMLVERNAFTVPAGWTAVEVPEAVELTSPFGEATVNVTFADGVLRSEWTFALRVTEVAPADYAAFREFVSAVDEAVDRVARFATGGTP
jgi:hypothetical protein